MRIALIHPSLSAARGDVRMKKGGGENVVVWLAAGLARKGHDVHVFVASYSDEAYGARESQPFAVHEMGGPEWRPSSLLEMWRFASRMRRHWAQFDLVSSHGYPSYMWVVLAKLRCTRFPPVVWYCDEPDRVLYDREFNAHFSFADQGAVGGEPGRIRRDHEAARRSSSFSPSQLLPTAGRLRLVRALDRRYVRSMSGVLANSRFTAARLETIYGPDVQVIPCSPGIPTLGQVAQQLGPDVVSIGRLLPSKNVDTLLRAMRLLADRGVAARLRIVGVGPDETRLHILTRQLGLEDWVLFRGLVPDEKMAAEFTSARVLAYVPFDEPFGLVPLEAGLRGIPSVVSSHGGPAETVLDEVTGLHADASSISSVADGLGRLLGDARLASNLGTAMRQQVLDNYTVERFVDRFQAAVVALHPDRRITIETTPMAGCR
jgi:glycosyltransferase involved in cell wall biosynthesis